MMLWEKKIQLAKETQTALDPNVGATEIREMGSEIHRMKLRYSSMLKIQEKMIAEMEKSVYRRDSISQRTQSKGKNGGQVALEKSIVEVTKKIRQSAYDVSECERDIESIEGVKKRITQEIDRANGAIEKLQEQEEGSNQMLEKLTATKRMLNSVTLVNQKMARHVNESKHSRYVYLFRDPVSRRVELVRQQEKLERVHKMFDKLEGVSENGLVRSIFEIVGGCGL